jgi:RNA polymerase sigma factor (TIGR02999 family)
MHREALLEQVYQQLRQQAELAVRQERPDHTLTATALVHEAYIRLGGSFENQAHFYAAAAQAMQRILVDHARSRRAAKRGGAVERGAVRRRVELPEVADWRSLTDVEEILALDTALSRLEAADAQAANVVRLRFFGGLEIEQAAQCLGISSRTVKRDWHFARAFLYRELTK